MTFTDLTLLTVFFVNYFWMKNQYYTILYIGYIPLYFGVWVLIQIIIYEIFMKLDIIRNFTTFVKAFENNLLKINTFGVVI